VKRFIVLFAAVALLALSLTSVVQAKGKGPVDAGGAPLNASGTTEIAANDPRFPGSCDFPVLVELSGKGKTIPLPNGGVLLTSPGLDATITNTETGAQETYNITGTVRVLPTDEQGNDVTLFEGRNLAIDRDAGFVVAVGDFSFGFDSEGNLIPLSGTGQLIDVCEALS